MGRRTRRSYSNDSPLEVPFSEARFQRDGLAVTLRLEDCFAGMVKMQAGSVDVVVTSPPYNIGIKYGVYDDRVSREEYLDWLEKWAELVERVLAPSGSVFLNIGGKPRDPWGPLEAALRLRKRFQLQNTIHWIKSIFIPKAVNGDDHGLSEDVNVGHIKPINSQRYLSDAHEYIFHFTRSGTVELDRLAVGVSYKDKSNIARWKSAGRDLRCRGNTWFIPYKTIVRRDRDRPHPASFPPQLAEMCIKLHGREHARTVLDPFMGLGSTAVACLRLGTSCIGYEIDPEYFKTSCSVVGREIAAIDRPPPKQTDLL